MSRYKMLSHTIWHCQYHVIWTPKYRYRILTGVIKTEVERCIRMFAEQLSCEIIELNIQPDHIHVIIMVPPKISISEAIGTIKGRCAIRIFQKFPTLRKKLYWGNHFWTKGYFVDTIGLDAEKIRKYVKFQEEKEQALELNN